MLAKSLILVYIIGLYQFSDKFDSPVIMKSVGAAFLRPDVIKFPLYNLLEKYELESLKSLNL